MNTRPALHKPQPPRAAEPRPRHADNAQNTTAPAPRQERGGPPAGETRFESELFEALLEPSAGTVMWQGAESLPGFDTPWRDPQGQGGRSAGSEPALEAWWESLLEALEAQLAAQQPLAVEAVLHLPTLGEVKVQVNDQSTGLDITLRFAEAQSWQRCRQSEDSSRASLSARLARPVRLHLEQAGA